MATASSDWLTRSRLNARQLSLLVQLDEKRSVLHAAEAAYLTQPAASKFLTGLEDALGVPLFTRHARGVEPTLYGEILVRHARGALAELRQAHEELAAARSGLTGEVSIGTTVTSATNLVPTAVTAVKKAFPRIRVNIDLDFSEALVRRLLDREFDIVIARLHHSPGAEELDFETLAEDPHGIAARVDHPLARKRGLALRDLVEQTWVMPPAGNVMRDRLTQLFLQKRLDLPHQVVETAALPIITSLLRMSEMVAPLPTDVVRPYCESGVLTMLPLSLDLRLGAAGIITRREHRFSPAAKVMLTALRKAAAAQYSGKIVRPK
ncbi:MAG TPA: LysR substrate-binding domain-containing protein [Casimicrobiaceae bacterium]|nr:LysR substrate-binding domain-containing protein [Casimicrobiaceae bacterium]